MSQSTPQEIATEVADVIRTIREEKWEAFSEASRQSGAEPYEMMGRLITKMVAEKFGFEIG